MTAHNARETWLLIDVGCAECRGWDTPPLVRILSTHATAEDAKLAAEAEVRNPAWKPHPQGGEFYGFGSGDIWVVPIEAFLTPQTDAKWPDV